MKSHGYLLLGVFVVAFSLTATQVVADEAVERVFCNARIFTGEPERPYAEAVAIRSDKITAVGSCVDVKKTVGNQGEIVDLHGQWLLPGFIDSHSHTVRGETESLVDAAVPSRVTCSKSRDAVID